MSGDRTPIALWALSLGVVSAAVGGTVAETNTAGAELRYVGALAVITVPVLYEQIRLQWDDWTAIHPFVRFVAFFLSLLLTVVVLDSLVGLLGVGGLANRALELVAYVLAVGVALWVTCYGGGVRIWSVALDHFGVEW